MSNVRPSVHSMGRLFYISNIVKFYLYYHLLSLSIAFKMEHVGMTFSMMKRQMEDGWMCEWL